MAIIISYVNLRNFIKFGYYNLQSLYIVRRCVVLKLCKTFQNDYRSSCKISTGSYQEQATPYANRSLVSDVETVPS